jgi:hypothetical protein
MVIGYFLASPNRDGYLHAKIGVIMIALAVKVTFRSRGRPHDAPKGLQADQFGQDFDNRPIAISAAFISLSRFAAD